MLFFLGPVGHNIWWENSWNGSFEPKNGKKNPQKIAKFRPQNWAFFLRGRSKSCAFFLWGGGVSMETICQYSNDVCTTYYVAYGENIVIRVWHFGFKTSWFRNFSNFLWYRYRFRKYLFFQFSRGGAGQDLLFAGRGSPFSRGAGRGAHPWHTHIIGKFPKMCEILSV